MPFVVHSVQVKKSLLVQQHRRSLFGNGERARLVSNTRLSRCLHVLRNKIKKATPTKLLVCYSNVYSNAFNSCLFFQEQTWTFHKSWLCSQVKIWRCHANQGIVPNIWFIGTRVYGTKRAMKSTLPLGPHLPSPRQPRMTRRFILVRQQNGDSGE